MTLVWALPENYPILKPHHFSCQLFDENHLLGNSHTSSETISDIAQSKKCENTFLIIVYFLKKTMLRHVFRFLLHQTSWAEFVPTFWNILIHKNSRIRNSNWYSFLEFYKGIPSGFTFPWLSNSPNGFRGGVRIAKKVIFIE